MIPPRTELQADMIILIGKKNFYGILLKQSYTETCVYFDVTSNPNSDSVVRRQRDKNMNKSFDRSMEE